ncbi:MAG: V-type ATP synthase subunit I [Methanobacteriaceae archaeon]|nr:V-type ATP synthase subunit I [Methanobacteriaceae archaeon]
MFMPAKMHKLKIITLDKYADSAVKSLHEKGIVQIHDISERIQQDAEWKLILNPSKATQYTSKISSLLMKTTGIVDFLGTVSKSDQSILDTVKGFISPEVPPKMEVQELETEELIEKAESLLGEVEIKTKALEESMSKLDSEKNELNNAVNVARKLEKFDIDLGDLEKTRYTSVIAGKLSSDNYDKFITESNTVTDKIIILKADEDNKKNDETLIIITLAEFGEKISSILRKLEFERFEVSGISGKPNDVIKESEIKIKNIETEKNKINQELADIASKWRYNLLVLKEELEIEKERNEIFSSFGETENTVMLEAWVPEKKSQEALKIIDESTKGHSVVEMENPDGEEVPVHLDNPRFAKPYQLFVEMYSPPSYKEIDPTILVAIVFPFFFGFCLTDAGYGIVDALVGFIIFRGLGRVNSAMRKIGLILIACGVWATILGLVTNSLLGDLLPRFLGLELPTVIGVIDSFKYPQNILIMALIVGVVYTIIGLILGAYNNIKRGETREAMGNQIVWLVMIVGVGLLAASFMYNIGSIYIGGAIVAIALVMLLYFNKLFGLLDISGFLGTILSYARLLALALATGGIAMTVNILTGLLGEMVPYVGFIIAPIIFVFGHIANGAFQTLGAFINALRLHYVEFFSQFYIGGSSKFRAFRAKRKLTKIVRSN